MDYSPFSKTHNLLNRSRSSSCSSPVRNRIHYQEVICNGDDTLVRSLSCDQFCGKDDNGQTQVWNQFQVYNFITPTKKLEESKGIKNKVWSVPKRLALEYPGKKSEVKARSSLKYPDSEKSETFNNSSINNRKGIFKKNKFTRETKMLLTATISAIALGVSYYIYQTPCTYEWKPVERSYVYRALSESVFGQKEAIDETMKLWNHHYREKTKSFVLTFTGGVGVGKTYFSSIIKDYFRWRSHKHISFRNHLISEGENYFKGKYSCGGHLVIIDDISILDSTKAILFTNRLMYNIETDGKLLIILIFQTQNNEQERLVVSQIEKLENFHHIPFKPLERHDIERCFMEEIYHQNVVIPKDKLNKLIDDQMSYIDVLKGPPGCKGISDQVSKFYQ